MAAEPGSIPACAGKPRIREGKDRPLWVHPRVCGEADYPDGDRMQALGPSPRVRGSHVLYADAVVGAGSIPACAGKPAAHSGAQG